MHQTETPAATLRSTSSSTRQAKAGKRAKMQRTETQTTAIDNQSADSSCRSLRHATSFLAVELVALTAATTFAHFSATFAAQVKQTTQYKRQTKRRRMLSATRANIAWKRPDRFPGAPTAVAYEPALQLMQPDDCHTPHSTGSSRLGAVVFICTALTARIYIYVSVYLYLCLYLYL